MFTFIFKFLYPTNIFFTTFYLLKVSFWIAIHLSFWNPLSERIWWVKHAIFYHIVVYDRFEGLHFHFRFWRPTSIFFRDFLPSKGFILNGNQSQILKYAFWMYMMGQTRPFLPNCRWRPFRRSTLPPVDSDAQLVFFSRLSTF